MTRFFLSFKVLHQDEYEQEVAKRQKTLDTAVAVFKQRHAAKNKTAASSDLQRRFNQYVAEMVSLDGLPFSVTKGLGFKRLVEFLRPEINMPSPRTVVRQLEAAIKVPRQRGRGGTFRHRTYDWVSTTSYLGHTPQKPAMPSAPVGIWYSTRCETGRLRFESQ